MRADQDSTAAADVPLRRRAVPLATVWLLILASLGVFLPYYALYLRENAGLSGSQIGAVFAVIPLVSIFAQPFWGVVADRTGLRGRALVVLAAGAAAGYLLLGRAAGFLAILVATGLLAAFSRALVPMTVSASLAALEGHRHAFGLVRVWGTLGFLASVVTFPWILDRYQDARGLVRLPSGPSEPGLELLFGTAAVLAAAAAVAAFALPNRGALALRAPRGEWRRLLRHGPFLRAVGVAFGAFLALHGPMELFPVYVRARGGDIDTVRDLWIVMLLPEIPLVAFLGQGVARLGPRRLLAVGVGAGGLRWLVCGLTGALPLVYAVQLLHAVVVAGLILGAPLYVDAVIPRELRSTGQALLGMVGVGLGGMGSSLLAGWLLEHYGPTAPYLAGGAGALGLALLLPWLLPPPARPGAATNASPPSPGQKL